MFVSWALQVAQLDGWSFDVYGDFSPFFLDGLHWWHSVTRLAGGFQNVMLMGAPSVDGFALNIQFQDCQAPGCAGISGGCFLCNIQSSQMDRTDHFRWKRWALQKFQWRALQWIRVETFSLSLGLRWHPTANLMPSWCPQKPRTKSSHHCRMFGHRYLGNLSNAWRRKAFSVTNIPTSPDWTFRRLKAQVMKPSCRLFGHSQAPSGILEGTSFGLSRILRDETCFVFVWCICMAICTWQVTAYYIWQTTGCNFTAGALYAVAMYLTTTAGVAIWNCFSKSDALFLSIFVGSIHLPGISEGCFPWSQHWECTCLTRQPYAYHGPPSCRCGNSLIWSVFASKGRRKNVKNVLRKCFFRTWKICLSHCHGGLPSSAVSAVTFKDYDVRAGYMRGEAGLNLGRMRYACDFHA